MTQKDKLGTRTETKINLINLKDRRGKKKHKRRGHIENKYQNVRLKLNQINNYIRCKQAKHIN